ncbi:hypothetical protein [Cupriavidus metallidurans]|jgi:hypothetical protein|uniref:hypothetical protein n=1 Tax=Cupriavidus metallidurans TaxID=119219 RepID=UPI0007638ACE|nr:hypothetical protein [Cupriavidus metallidurans]KWW37050.1 hypothetical protein AU374_03117 [Cupriavidus metallidurans]
MVDPIFRKTEAGQEEIRTRERKLDQKLRALLLIVNGERARSELVAQVGALGVAGEALDTLLALGLIEPIPAPTGAKPALSTAQATVRPTTGPARSAPQRPPAETNLFAAYSSFNTSDGKGIDDVLADTTIAPGALPAAKPSAQPATPAPDGYQRLYHFYTDVIGNHLGLRGYMLQVKVEKAATLVELAALRDMLGAALQKAKGEITARAIIDQLDQLLAEMGLAPVR